MDLPLTRRHPPSEDSRIQALMKRPHPMDKRDLFASDGFSEIRRLGRLALRLSGDERMNTYFALGDLCAQRTLSIDQRLLVFYAGKTLNAYLRARSDASDSVNRRLAERARADYLAWLVAMAQAHPSRHNLAVALWALAETSESDPQAAALHEPTVPRLLALYRAAADRSPRTGGGEATIADDDTEMDVGGRLRAHLERTAALASAVSAAGDETLADVDPPEAPLSFISRDEHPEDDGAGWQGAQPPAQGDAQIERMLQSLEGDTVDEGDAFADFERDSAREQSVSALLTRAPEPGGPGDALAGEYREGDHIDARYEVASVLLGGMGVVYLCYDHHEAEPVALKSFQNRFLQNERAIARFEQEALTWIRLEKHRHIVQARLVQRIGSRPYILLEHVSGPEGLGTDLRSWIEHRRLNTPQAVELALHVALGMQHATTRVPGLVHRDLKPANILVTHDGIAKVTDFGLVRSLDVEEITPIDLAFGRAREDGRLTRMGSIIGTAPYLSPEQCRSNRVDTRADIYAFGCMLHEMLTGHFVFQGRTLAAWIHAHLHEAPAFSAQQRALLPPRLTGLVLACLAKAPADRPQHWGEIVQELAAICRELTGADPVMHVSGPALEAHELMDKAYSLTELGRVEESLLAYDRALALGDRNAWVWARKGRALRLLRRMDEALACYDRALALDPRYAWAWKGRGIVLERVGRLAEALEAHHTAASIDPADVWNWYNQAEVLMEMGEADRALVLLSRALETDPRHANSWAKRGQILRAQRRYSEAVDAYRSAVSIDPSFAWAHNGLGLALKALGETSEAVLSFRRAVRSAPREVWYWYNLAETLVETQQYDEALGPAQQAVRVDPGHANSWAKLGQILRYLKRYDEALKAYERSLSLQSENAWAQNGKGIVLERLKRFDEALHAYQRATALSPGDVWYAYNHGSMLLQLGRPAEAAAVLQALLQRHPGHTSSWARLGSAHRQLGALEPAREALQQAVRLQPDFAWAWGELGQVCQALGDMSAAEDAFARAGQSTHGSGFTVLRQADQLIEAEQSDEAASLLKRVLEAEGDNPELWSKLGVALRRAGQHAEAASAFERAIELHPGMTFAWNGLGIARVALRQHSEALAAFAQVVALNPGDVWAWYRQGDVLTTLGRPQDAAARLERAVALDPALAEGWAKLGLLYRKLDRLQESLSAYDRALGIQPEYSWAWNGRGLTLEALGRREEAAASYERAVAQEPTSVWHHNNLIDVLLALRRRQEALHAARAAVTALPESAQAWARLGLVQRRLKLPAEAVESYGRAVALDPHYGWAWNGLGLAHVMLHQYEEAAEAYATATTCNPEDVWFWRNRGDALMLTEQFTEAVAAFSEALRLQPDDVGTRRKLQIAREALGE
jgi:tetratricopeptide (TPR) repeat protein/tRNA A-37 threonylcarbamoyl transferase component Bud32